jgi:Putative Actinobacterial Holin-X, holin superfamily III
MATPRADEVENPLKEISQAATEQALVLARQQVELVGTMVKQAAPGAAKLGGAAVLAALASGTGTAALVLALARRPRASAAALGVTGAYAGVGALLARDGLERLREAGLLPSGDTADDTVQEAKKTRRSAKRSATSSAKSAARSTSRQASTAAKRGASRKPVKRARRRVSQRAI